MERIHDNMYLPGLGELGIALQNITYINERITYVNTFSSQTYYGKPFDMSAKYMSSTLYYNNNIVNENYTNNATIDNIWSIDLNEAYITFSSIKSTEYNIMPMYKYVPTSTYMGGDDHIDTGDTIIEETEEPEIQLVEDEDERYTYSSYFCTNLNYRLSSYMFNYKSDNDISTLSANTYIRFSYIPTFYHHKFWPLQHIKKTITFNYVHDDIDRNDYRWKNFKLSSIERILGLGELLGLLCFVVSGIFLVFYIIEENIHYSKIKQSCDGKIHITRKTRI
jgi:hypothetical protein